MLCSPKIINNAKVVNITAQDIEEETVFLEDCFCCVLFFLEGSAYV